MWEIAATEVSGKTILHYRIIDKIGEGGMGVVFKAKDTSLDRIVAIKFLPPQIASSSDKRERFRTEAKAAAALNHPNIGTIYAIEQAGDKLFIVMEYIEGRELREIIGGLGGGQLSFAQVLDYAQQILDGLHAAHEKGIIHRDLKSSNIMVTKNGRIKILDFGLAKSPAGIDLTKSTDRFGTPHYMAPEQIIGKSADCRTDIFAFGVILYELMTGLLPFTGEQDMSVLYAIMNEEPPLLTLHRSDVPDWLEGLATKCLQKQPDNRFQSSGEILSVLRSHEVDFSNSRLAAIESKRKEKAFRKKRRRTVMGFMIVLILLIFAAFLAQRHELFDFGKVSNKADTGVIAVAVLPFSMQGSAEDGYLANGIARLLGSKLDGAGELRCIDLHAINSMIAHKKMNTASPTDGQEIAEHFGARHFILGSIFSVGGQLAVEAELYDTRAVGPPIARSEFNCSNEELFGNVDKLAADLLTNVSSFPNDRLSKVAAITTHSLPALKSFLIGENRFQAGEYQRALEAFQEAIRYDSTFALAYYRTSLTADWLTRPDLAHQAAEQAVLHSGRLTESDRALLEALRAWQDGEADRAERLYRSVIGANPENVDAWFQLGEVLFHYGPLAGRSISFSRKSFERVLQLEPKHVPSLWHLARIASVEERSEEMSNLVQQIQSIQPLGEREPEMLALNAFAFRDENEKNKVLALLKSENDYVVTLAAWTVAVFTKDFWQAADILKLLLYPERSAEAQVLGRVMLAHLYLARGQMNRAREQLALAGQTDEMAASEYAAYLEIFPPLQREKARLSFLRESLSGLELPSPQPSLAQSIFFTAHNDLHPHIRSYLLGMLDARLGDYGSAKEEIGRLNDVAGMDGNSDLVADFIADIKAEIALSDGRLEEALTEYDVRPPYAWYGLTIVSPFFSGAYRRFQRAKLLLALNRLDEAVPLYNSFSDYSVYDLIYLAPAHLQLGEIYERMGKRTEAISSYQHAIGLWQNCDAEFIPLREKARERLDLLKAEKKQG